MTSRIQRQRGEGKVGCIISLVVLLLALAVTAKALPVYWNTSQLKDAAKDMATRASVVNVTSIEVQLRAKAMELGIPQAAAPGAITVRKVGDNLQGTCSVTLKFTQKIDFYGLMDYTLETDDTIKAPYIFSN